MFRDGFDAARAKIDAVIDRAPRLVAIAALLASVAMAYGVVREVIGGIRDQNNEQMWQVGVSIAKDQLQAARQTQDIKDQPHMRAVLAQDETEAKNLHTDTYNSFTLAAFLGLGTLALGETALEGRRRDRLRRLGTGRPD